MCVAFRLVLLPDRYLRYLTDISRSVAVLVSCAKQIEMALAAGDEGGLVWVQETIGRTGHFWGEGGELFPIVEYRIIMFVPSWFQQLEISVTGLHLFFLTDYWQKIDRF